MRLPSRFIILTFLALLGMGVTAGLGSWQLKRAATKEAMARRTQVQAALPELDGQTLLKYSPVQDLQHRRVHLRGRWLHAHSVWLNNRQMRGRVGFYLLTPLILEGSDQAVLVQRGWVPRQFDDRTRLPALPDSDAELELSGRIALSPSKIYELGQGERSAIRQNIDLAAFSAEIHVPLVPVTVVQSEPGDSVLLRDWPAIDTGIDKHHGYAFQWFGLCALIASLYVWFQIVRRRR